MEIKFLGHAGFLLNGSKKVYIDPFLTGNPTAGLSVGDIKEADYMIITHGHADHLGDAYQICKNTGATLVSIHEIAVDAGSHGVISEGMNRGGSLKLDGITVHMTDAKHSSDLGHECGVVVEMDNKRVYHSGDTGLFMDMKLIGEFLKPHIALLPIGDRYTMGIESAVRAVEYIGAPKVIPMHYNTFPIIEADPQAFKNKVGNKAEVIILKPGESTKI
ncbi:metal-dependent hydrolase [bacterium]|nr:metal-dependent hydrolase [bacterium]